MTIKKKLKGKNCQQYLPGKSLGNNKRVRVQRLYQNIYVVGRRYLLCSIIM